MLYIFEDNEAVFGMIFKGRSRTMRHVSRTHRVALGWLFDRINLDTNIQVKYVDTKSQLADIFMEGIFTSGEKTHRSHKGSQTSKWQSEHEGERGAREVAKSRPVRNFVSLVPTTSSSRWSARTISISPGRPEGCYQNSDAISSEKLETVRWNDGDVLSSQERQPKGDLPIHQETTYAPQVGRNGTTGDVALDCIPLTDHN